MNFVNRFAMLSITGMLFACAAGAAETPTPPAQSQLDQAIQKAKAENKAIFVHFSASW